MMGLYYFYLEGIWPPKEGKQNGWAKRSWFENLDIGWLDAGQIVCFKNNDNKQQQRQILRKTTWGTPSHSWTLEWERGNKKQILHHPLFKMHRGENTWSEICALNRLFGVRHGVVVRKRCVQSGALGFPRPEWLKASTLSLARPPMRLPPGPGDRHSVLRSYEFGSFRFLTEVESCSIRSLVTGLVRLVLSVPSCCHTGQDSLLFKEGITFHCAYLLRFLYPLAYQQTFKVVPHFGCCE